MKKILMMISMIFVMTFFTACNETNDSAKPEKNNANAEQSDVIEEGNSNSSEDANAIKNNGDNQAGNNPEGNSDNMTEAKNQDDMKEMMKQLNFSEIEIEVSYGKNKEYEFKIEHHSNGDIEAEVEDEINGIDIDEDLAAFNHLFPLVKMLTVEQGMDKQEVINQVLDVFELDRNYEKFDAEFTFEKGIKVEFEDKK